MYDIVSWSIERRRWEIYRIMYDKYFDIVSWGIERHRWEIETIMSKDNISIRHEMKNSQRS